MCSDVIEIMLFNHKYLVQFSAMQCSYGYFSHFKQFQVGWIIFINFELNGHDLCHVNSKHSEYYHLFTQSSVQLTILAQWMHNELTDLWAINASNV